MSYLRTTLCRPVAVLFGLVLGSTTIAFGQTAARVEGRATDAMGRPMANAVVRLISDPAAHANGRPWRYTLVGDSLGKYSQEGIAPGAYLVMLYTDGKGTSILKSVSLRAGDRSVVNFDMRPTLQVAGTSGPGPRIGGAPLRHVVQMR